MLLDFLFLKDISLKVTARFSDLEGHIGYHKFAKNKWKLAMEN